ncbi:MAG: LemA family protein [Deltaproteobacteria bacterium]|nr:LemA family protein [Deltaproteobacteria bacterium]
MELPPIPRELGLTFGGGGLGMLLAVVVLRAARRADQENYVVARATELPLRLLNPRDDAWVRGVVECERPLVAPHFGVECVAFDYTVERRVQRGRNSSWETQERRHEACAFALSEGGRRVRIDGEAARFEGLEERTVTEGNRRYSLGYLPPAREASAVGSVSEDRSALEPHANIPLIVTPKGRREYLAAAEGGEAAKKYAGAFLAWAGLGAALYALFAWSGWPRPFSGGPDWPTIGAALAVGAAALLPFWMVAIYNTCVAYRARIDNAWRQIDVDLKMRSDLIPGLVGAARGYLAHEADLLATVTRLRTEALAGRPQTIRAETEMAPALLRFVKMAERYPELGADAVVAGLMRELTAIEEKIAFGRSFFNDTVTEYNTYVLTLPRRLIAVLAGFSPFAGFALDPRNLGPTPPTIPGSSTTHEPLG